MFHLTRHVVEASMIFSLRQTVGEEAMYENADSLSPEQRSKLSERHPNQTAGIIGGWQDEQ